MDPLPAPRPEPTSPRLPTLLLGYGLLALILAGELLLPGHSLFRWDTLIYNWPLVVEARSQILAGHWPFWTSSICAGTPLLENINAGVLYPLKLLMYVLPIRTGGHLFLFTHVWLSFVGMHLFVQRGLGLRPSAAFIAAVAFGASGYARSMWDTHNFVSLPWIPLVLWSVSAPMSPRRRCAHGMWIWALLLYGGDLQQAILAVPAAALLMIARRTPWRDQLAAGLGLLGGLLLAAPQLLPAMDWARYSYRAGGLAIADAAERSFHPARLIEMLLPHFYGTRDAWRGLHLAWGEKGAPWISSFHVGLVPLALAVFAVRSRRREAWWGVALALGGIAIAFGGFAPWFALWQKLPLVGSFRYPEKYLLWSTLGLSVLAAFGTAAATELLGRSARRPVTILALAALASLAIPWWTERPTTARFEPQDVPVLLQAVRASDEPEARVFVDPTLGEVPLPPYFADLRPSEKQAVFYRERLDYNSPRLFGCATVSGFSPAESGEARRARERAAGDPSGLAHWFRSSGARWMVTTPARRTLFEKAGLPLSPEVTYGRPVALELCRAADVARAVASPGGGHVVRVWTPRPGFLRVDLADGGTGTVQVTETWAPGWRACDQSGRSLPVTRQEGFMVVGREGGTTQIRLTYEPPRWRLGLLLALAGSAGLLVAVRPIRLRAGPVCAVLFIVVSVAARSHWSTTFDEGFHLTRGLALRHFQDSRLSFFHPPVQNVLGAWFADLAFGDRLRLPPTPAWKMANSSAYAVDVAYANAGLFEEMVRASRWSSTSLAALMILLGAWWAGRWGGPLAGWVCGLGLALNPNLLAHGSLNTTDCGVTAFVFGGMALLWFAHRKASRAALLGAAAAFTLGGLTKFTGLIWLGTFLILVVPVLCRSQFPRRWLWLIPANLAVLAAAILWLYGWDAQAVRQVRPDGKSVEQIAKLPAGRFLEGILVQSQHAREGHKAWFHGHGFERGSWWHMPLGAFLKSPLVWSAGLALAAGILLRRRAWSRGRWVPWLPMLVFIVLLLFVNRMAIGVRHALPLIALGTLVGAVALNRLNGNLRTAAVAFWALGFAIASAASYPRYLSYFPSAFGGVTDGHNWLVDSNYDWGQELPALEAEWGRLTQKNGGRPPDLVYFGFVDPRSAYALEVGPGSYCGFCMSARGQAPAALGSTSNVAVASISALALEPGGLSTEALRSREECEHIGAVWRVLSASARAP